jgi:hypothetical protein
MNENTWFRFTDRYGAQTRNIDISIIKTKINELIKTPDKEHPNIGLTAGTEDEVMYEVDYYGPNLIIISKYNDIDYDELVYEKKLNDCSAQDALELFKAMLDQDFEKIDNVAKNN